MVDAQAAKWVSVTPPAAIVDDSGYTTAAIDTLGFDYAEICIYLGATDIAMAALKVQESDASGSGYADISGADFDGDTNIDGSAAALPSATDDNKFMLVQLDLRNRKRYLDVVATAGNGSAGTYATILCRLSRAGSGPYTVAQAGADEVLRIA